MTTVILRCLNQFSIMNASDIVRPNGAGLVVGVRMAAVGFPFGILFFPQDVALNEIRCLVALQALPPKAFGH